MAASDSDYPVRFEVDYPESSSKLLALLGVIFLGKIILLIPHIGILMVLSILSFIAYYIGYWAVLITGSYPRGLFDFVAGVQRWSTRTDSWINGLTDRYPPFSLGEADHPTKFEVDYPESSSRLLALLGAIFFGKIVLLFPHPPLAHPLLSGNSVIRCRLHRVLGGSHNRQLSQGAVQLGSWNPAMVLQDERLADRLDGPISAIQPGRRRFDCNELIQRLLADTFALRGSTVDVQVHPMRAPEPEHKRPR